ncbi:hypothetical protein Bca52824_050867 [Brassica carinata]|uniref:SUI1 domain-containing protein n=1 Tax=Brassica carinata TaxID=52824 RepID=A0A8X7UI45_BRACI|nr:hypothetical protein Bca52824_050867 [Brassica carinata]
MMKYLNFKILSKKPANKETDRCSKPGQHMSESFTLVAAKNQLQLCYTKVSFRLHIYEYHHQSMAEKLEPAKVLYCGVCSVHAITASSVLISADVSHGSLKKLQISILTYSKMMFDAFCSLLCSLEASEKAADNISDKLQSVGISSGGADGAPSSSQTGGTSKKEEVKRLPGGKLKKKERQEVIIEKVVRNKRKCITIVKGLELFGELFASLLGKKFATGASVVKGPTEKEQIDIQGDIIYDIVEFITRHLA